MNPYLIFLAGGFAGLFVAGLVGWGVASTWARVIGPQRTVIAMSPLPKAPRPAWASTTSELVTVGPPPAPTLPVYAGPTLVRGMCGEPILLVTKVDDLAAAGCLFGGFPTWGRS